MPHEYTEYEISELIKCIDDPIYFMEHYCKVSNVNHEPRLIVLSDLQREIVNNLKNGNVKRNLKRQAGKTTIGMLYMMWLSIFHPDKTSMFIGITNAYVKHHRRSFQDIYDGLPHWIASPMKVSNVRTVVFDNNSRIIWGPCVEHTGKGMTINFLFLDELSFGRSSTIIMFLQSILPTLVVAGKLLSLSTYNASDPELSQWVTGPLELEISHDNN